MDLRNVVRLGVVVALGASVAARASTGICDSNPPTTTDACINAIQASGGVVNDIFHDKNGRTGNQLPSFGKVINVYPACGTMNCAGCNPGTSNAPYDCPGQYACTGGTCTLATVGVGVNALDRQWGHPCRLTQHTLVGGCPQYGSCVADGDPQGYYPWEGLVFDLGGPSNQVAIFAENDHGPQPCESAEYTIFLTDNPQSQDIVLQPTTTGADPQKWNRAVLKKVFTKGFVEVRTPDPVGHGATCGDTAQYSVEEDSMVTVYGLPCGINFRYAAVVAGNDGLDFPACQFHSSEAELDAVAGLTEDGAGVCPDVDKDGYATCACAGAPVLCDCDDADPTKHPNAAEACDATQDLNCNGHAEPCPAGTGCHAGVCVPKCASSELGCPLGSTCEADDAGVQLCIATDCTTGGCPPGAVCDTVTQTCRAACDQTVVCPYGQRCVGGSCIDLCRGVTCSSGFSCVDGVCTPPCSCFAGDVGCTGTNRCDRPDGGAGTNQCVAPSCVGVVCGAGQHCGPSGTCVGLCDGVKCPPNEVCVPPTAGPDAGTKVGCVNLCAGVACPAGTKCSNATGACVDDGTMDAGVDAGNGGGTGGGAGGGSGGGAGGANGTGGSGGGGKFTAKSGCGCGALPGGDAMVLLGALGLLTSLGRRLARRQRS